MQPELGLIEGFYGKPWSWQARHDAVRDLAPYGYGFFHYAPKADAFLRRRWQELHPDEEAEALRDLADHCRRQGVRFGIGLSPYEIYRDFDSAARQSLAAKLDQFAAIGLDDLAILFDDMRGDMPDLAQRQIEITHWIAARAGASRLIMCPSYYSDDPILDRVFGQRPDDYLPRLGRELDPAIHIYWTGPRVCSPDITPDHLRKVTDQLRRKPFLWDNYPVNDGPRMSPHLHLRAFTGRAAANADLVAAHGINPASQPVLSRIPAISLNLLYAKGDAYDPQAAFREAAMASVGPELAGLIEADLASLQDEGREKLPAARTDELRARYQAIDHAAAREIVDWLEGHWIITGEAVMTQ